jgi:D-aminopeptidase
MISNRANNIYDDILSKLENQIKRTETDLTKEKESVLFGIECKMEEATDNKEILPLVKQCDEAEKKFEQEQINHRRKTVKGFVNELGMLTKHIKKVYSKELNNK